VHALKRNLESQRIDESRVREELAAIERYRHWEVLGYPSRDAMLDAELGALSPTQKRVLARITEAPDMVGAGARTDLQPSSIRRRFLPAAGHSTARLAARLKRNYPDICARIAAGEFPSIRAAAKAAGIIHDKTPLDQLRHWWRKADAVAQQTFRQEIAGKDDAA
jgi:hypothetical protein